MRGLVIGVFLILWGRLAQCQSDVCQDSKQWGFVCKDCQTMATCINLAGTWRTVELGKCDNASNLFCNRETRNCSTTRACDRPARVAFTCNSEGIFPDPYDCKVFHTCSTNGDPSKLTLTTMQCATPYAFSPVTNECSARTTDEICRRVQYDCNRVGNMGAWPGNANIFYICVQATTNGNTVTYPVLYRCPPGERFSGSSCNAQGTSQDTPSTSTTPAPQCSQEGLSPHPTNCTLYYYCNHRRQQVQYACPQNSYFNNNQKACVPGTC